MTHASLFSGIGGFDYAAEVAGWTNVFSCEIDSFCNYVLKEYHEKTEKYYDIKTTDFTVWRGRVDVLSGGFPCQPYSVAGKRLGKNDERHLFPEMLRAIREIQPRWVVGENVRGIISWNGGLVFEEVCASLEAIGYEVQPFILPACGIGAPHRRDRVWFVAHNSSYGKSARTTSISTWKEREQQRSSLRSEFNADSSVGAYSNSPNTWLESLQCGGENGFYEFGTTSDTKNIRLQFTGESREWRSGLEDIYIAETNANTNGKLSERRSGKDRPEAAERHISTSFCDNAWENFPTQSPICSGDDGISTELLRNRLRELSHGILREEEIDKIISGAIGKLRKESIKAYGNAVVPQLVYKIFQAINEYEKLNYERL